MGRLGERPRVRGDLTVFDAADSEARTWLATAGLSLYLNRNDSSVEAGATHGWHRYADDTIGIERFGVSAPGNIVMDKLGINVGHVVERAKALLDRKE